MLTRVFDRNDTELYAAWHLEEGGTVTLYIPELGSVRMTLAKAEEVSANIAQAAEYGRYAAEELSKTVKQSRSRRFDFDTAQRGKMSALQLQVLLEHILDKKLENVKFGYSGGRLFISFRNQEGKEFFQSFGTSGRESCYDETPFRIRIGA